MRELNDSLNRLRKVRDFPMAGGPVLTAARAAPGDSNDRAEENHK